MLGSVAFFVAALIAFLTAGAGSLLGEVANIPDYKEDVNKLTWHGMFGLIGSIVALIGACLSVAKPRTASVVMLIGLITGCLATGYFSIPGVILLTIAVIFAFLGRNERPKETGN